MAAEGDASLESGNGDSGAAVIHVRCSNGLKVTLTTSLESIVGDFKVLLAQNCDVPANQQRLIYKGRILKDDQTLESYGLQADHTVHMVRGFAPPASTPPAAASADTQGVTRGVGSTQGAGLGVSSFPGLGINALSGGDASGLFGAGLPEFEQLQQQMTQNPNMMRDMMNMPAIQNLMNNPEIMRGLIMNNPQMRDIIDRNPELAHVLNDPNTLRQTLEAARNPELMREMMRNTDRAMSNIESMPEGFNMLRRMYENVQEPFLNATTGGGTGNDVDSNPFAALLGNQGGGHARDGSNNPSTTGSETAAAGVTAPNTNPLPNPWGNTNTRSNPVGGARPVGIGSLGGLSLSGVERPSVAQMTQLLQNPAMSQMMHSLFSNPEYMNQIINLNPQLRASLDANPQLREMMQNPEILRQMMAPETMRQMMALHDTLLSPLNSQQSTLESGPGGGATTGTENNNQLEMIINMFNRLQAEHLNGQNTSSSSNVPAEELYATQLSQLQEMGFFDAQENIRALRATSGNVHAAVERLLGNPGQ